MSETLIEKLEKCGFECQAGPLENSVQYRDLKDRTDLWALEVRGQTRMHTDGANGWRFSVFTSRSAAQHIADQCNDEQFGGAKTMTVRHLLEDRSLHWEGGKNNKGQEPKS